MSCRTNNDQRRLCLFPVVAILIASGILSPVGQAAAQVARDGAYQRVMEVLARQPHRLPGSVHFDEALHVVKSELEAAGLSPRVQTFSTLVPVTAKCELKVAGRMVEGALPFDGGVAPLTTEGELSGPLVHGGDGSLAALSGRPVDGSIVLIDMDLPRAKVDDAFMKGARAVVAVGSESWRIWDALHVIERGVASVPMVYIDRADAERGGLFAAEGAEASLDVAVAMKTVRTGNLWVELPATDERVFNLGSPETLILSATLGSFGIVPDFSPDMRRAANVALLTDVLCQLADRSRPRSIMAVFHGNHYSIQEGARYFMYGIGGGRASGTERDVLANRAEMLVAEKAYFDELVTGGERDDLIESTDRIAQDLVSRMREWLVAAVNNINAELREQRIRINHLERFLDSSREMSQETRDVIARLGTGGDEELAGRSIATLKASIERLEAEKKRWNDLRQLITRSRPAEDETIRKTYILVRETIRRHVVRRRDEIAAEIADSQTHIEVYARVREREIVAQFDFDFSRADRPWLLGVIGNLRPIRYEAIGLGSFLRHFSEIGNLYAEIRDDSWAAPLYEAALRPYFKPSSLSIPGVRCLPTLPAAILGIPGFQMMTLGASLDYDGMPLRETVDLHDLAGQMATVVDALSHHEGFSIARPFKTERMEDRFVYTFREGGAYRGTQLVNYCRGSSDVEGPASDAVLVLHGDASIRTPESPHYLMVPTNVEGRLFAPMINTSFARSGWMDISAVGYDSKGRVNRLGAVRGIPAQRMNLFYAYGGGLFSSGYGPDLLGSDLYTPQTLNARTDASPRNLYGVRLGRLATYYTDREIRFKRIGGRGEMLLVATEEKPMGIGILLDDDAMLRLDGVRQCAEDYWLLNESRLHALRQRNIVYDSLEEIHAQAKEHLAHAEEARSRQAYPTARAHHIAATSLENRVYAPLRAVTDDLVRAVVLLLLLNIPFAFAMERLVCGFTNIYKQVGGFAGFFVATFLVLYFTHPAFSLASAPIVIFLAFVIILLGTVTLYIVLGKIKQEIRMIQGLASTVHGKESDSSTALAAILIGISGMRNRPLKTVLTAVTVILLTFTILVFGSFSSEYGVVETYLGQGRGEDRVELHTFSHLDIPHALIEAIAELYEQNCHVFRRGGMFLNPAISADHGVPALAPDRVVFNPVNGRTTSIGAIFGLERGERAFSQGIAEVVDWEVEGLAHPPLYLSRQMAEHLQVGIGGTLKLMGRNFSLAGLIDEGGLRGMTTIDETPITPPDFAATLRNTGAEQGAGRGQQALAEIDSGMYEWFPPGTIAIAELHDLEDAFGRHMVYSNFALIYPSRIDVDLLEVAREVATLFQGAIHVKTSEGARRMFFTRAISGSGFGDVIVPLLLGGLIIFSSLMGSIVDREREIFTYSALGLSPPSVGALFFAESAVYSVIGGIGGYLLSQVVARLVAFMGALGWFRPPSMNFSSLSSVTTILVVMGVVMLSTIIPAVKAGRSANPGVARKWKMPSPKGDDLTFVFPFTVSEPDFKGILSFIREHFENHGDATLGGFAAREVKLFKRTLSSGKESLGIQAEISLAPFDLGIFQTFKMYSQEFEIKGIDEVVVDMHRIGGTRNSWIRSTRNFAAELREQFLLWRALPIATVEHYRAQTDATFVERDRDEN